MKLTTQEFISRFHALDGITVGERRKNLFNLLKRIKKADELDFTCIQPKNLLEEKFKVDTLIYFRRISDLVELLKCENPILIRRILKSKVLKEIFQNITDEQLVTKILPYISFRTKERILNKLSQYLKDPQCADEFYEAIHKKYGLYLASKLLSSCSLGVIMNDIKFNKTIFSPKQVQIIIKRYPRAAEDILKALLDNNCIQRKNYDKIFNSILKDDTLLSKLRREYDLSFCLDSSKPVEQKVVSSKEADVLEADIHYCLLHNLPLEQHLTKWLEMSGQLNIFKEHPSCEKQCILAFGKLIPQLFQGKEGELGWNVDFLCALVNWNYRHPKDEISLFYYINIFNFVKQHLLEAEHAKIASIIKYLLHSKINTEETRYVLKLYLSNPHIDLEVINRLIQCDPLIVAENIESVTHSLLNNKPFQKHLQSRFWRCCNDYLHLGIPSKIRKICRKVLLEELYTFNLKTENAVSALSYLMPASGFLKVIPYYSLTADLKSEEGQKIHKFQKLICVCLKNVIPSSRALKSILLFCTDDFLQLIMPSLCSATNNINEDKLVLFYKELLENTIKVKKCATHLMFRVLEKEQTIKVFYELLKVNENAPIRKFIFKCAFNFFVKNPNDSFWELVKFNINDVDTDDREAFEMVIQIDKIPHRYFLKYVEFMWYYLNKPPKDESDRVIFLNSFPSEKIQILPKEFCEITIRTLFFNNNYHAQQSAVQSFICRYIIYCDSQVERDERFNTICAVIKYYMTTKRDHPEISHVARRYSTFFLTELCLEFLKNKCSDKTILLKFVDFWNNIVMPQEAFGEYLHLQLTLLYMEKLSLSEIGQKLSELCDSQAYIYGSVIIDMFCDKIDYFMPYFVSETDEKQSENRYILLQNLIKHESSLTCSLLVILLLNRNTPDSPKAKELYNEIVKTLENKPEPVIQVYLQSHFHGVDFTNYPHC